MERDRDGLVGKIVDVIPEPTEGLCFHALVVELRLLAHPKSAFSKYRAEKLITTSWVWRVKDAYEEQYLPINAVFACDMEGEFRTCSCRFGGEDGSTLFITANTRLVRIRLNVKGVGF